MTSMLTCNIAQYELVSVVHYIYYVFNNVRNIITSKLMFIYQVTVFSTFIETVTSMDYFILCLFVFLTILQSHWFNKLILLRTS